MSLKFVHHSLWPRVMEAVKGEAPDSGDALTEDMICSLSDI
jgi:hypothetical protein